MIESFRNLFAVPDLRQRILFTFALLALYRLGCNLPLPGIDLEVLAELSPRHFADRSRWPAPPSSGSRPTPC